MNIAKARTVDGQLQTGVTVSKYNRAGGGGRFATTAAGRIAKRNKRIWETC